MYLKVARFIAFVALLIQPVTASAQGETVEYYGLDAIGSVRIVFDPSGNVLARLDYEPFGRLVSSASNAPDRKFAGLFRDSEAGLDHAGARSYQSRTGRFSTVDPVYAGLFEPQKWNRYTYALNSPLVYVDPNGLDPDECKEGQLEDGQTTYCHSGGTYSTSNNPPPPIVTVWFSLLGDIGDFYHDTFGRVFEPDWSHLRIDVVEVIEGTAEFKREIIYDTLEDIQNTPKQIDDCKQSLDLSACAGAAVSAASMMTGGSIKAAKVGSRSFLKLLTRTCIWVSRKEKPSTRAIPLIQQSERYNMGTDSSWSRFPGH